jgi:hypothetical protein
MSAKIEDGLINESSIIMLNNLEALGKTERTVSGEDQGLHVYVVVRCCLISSSATAANAA